jgi:hypothetical protein
MGIFVQKSDGNGSLKDLQVLINQYQDILNTNIIHSAELPSSTKIKWLSPLSENRYAEYRDNEFLEILKLGNLRNVLEKYWPQNGPQWDGMGISDNDIFLIEAKAHITEIVSPPSGAKNQKSIILIRQSLNSTKKYIGSKSLADWSSYFYQYTNRLAYLYFFRKNKVRAFLVFIYFIGDKRVAGPNTKGEWLAALTVMKKYLGIPERHRLSPYIIEVFINIKDIGL